MVEIKATEFQEKRRERNHNIALSFKEQKTKDPGASNADCIRGLAEYYEVNSSTIRIALKEEGLL